MALLLSLYKKLTKNNMSKLYYEAPTDEQFNELKSEAIKLWATMGDEPSYSKEKIDRIKDIKNVSDNFMYIVSMYDIFDQAKLASQLSDGTKKAVSDRIIDGGTPPEYNKFNTDERK